MATAKPLTTNGPGTTLAQRWRDIRTGFERPFWVANLSELFERLSYYAAFASLARYLHEALHFPIEQTGTLTGFFGGLVWFLPVFGGTLADRMGFRRALSLAYLILSCAYFLLGSIAAPWLAPVRNAVPLVVLVTFILALPALGVALVKPSVVGTTARASNEKVRSIGYAIYYTLVNIGGAAGPYVASYVHQHMNVQNVFRVSALSVFLMFVAVLLFFREPRRHDEVETTSLAQAARNFWTVVTNPRFMLFLVIFTGYWIVYWQEFITLPLYVHAYVNPRANTELLLVTGPLVVIAFTVVINLLTQRIHAFSAIILGTLITALAWVILILRPTVVGVVLTLIGVALGEITQSPRYYEYISRLAPSGQQGTYMGFAFLPLGIGSLVGGPVGGFLIHYFGEVKHQPVMMWVVITAVGVLTAVLLWIYDRLLRRREAEPAA
ncbi:MAG TPA: MFS transporter [Terriglobales bacterium]|nr:MFS transporter [Terriglobales bacterium]